MMFRLGIGMICGLGLVLMVFAVLADEAAGLRVRAAVTIRITGEDGGVRELAFATPVRIDVTSLRKTP